MSALSFRGNSSGIAYTVKVSRRARHARLKMSPEEGLTVVLPVGFDPKRVSALVESKMEWIMKVQGNFDKHRAAEPAQAETALPEAIELAGVGESWRVEYRYDPLRPGIFIRELDGNVLDLSGGVDNRAWCFEALEQWLKHRAKLKLGSQLTRLAAINGFKISGVSVKKQKSRWGSCSSRGNINLNLKLIFLPPELVRYIMIHELCHTLHMDHSARYWEAVARYDPDYAVHDREMKHAWRFVPAWFSSNR
ncbi:M48 family metallopeptidase [Chlorobaculum thiosulfatiphilum]|uniref:M48 family metallopeptidase n=1 Tax=Chlorobaculum thiosulfatiphilum TaxID=115852 RepID=A0A5C4S6N4_CHLTI|nr:SprT family zinc-dependent metalloprotease [Chlorobaculum thiosulfatiphilum]TNJ39183.1 M48 family metallopeptidase [Chlorobaculum thiosulfatiphilum]